MSPVSEPSIITLRGGGSIVTRWAACMVGANHLQKLRGERGEGGCLIFFVVSATFAVVPLDYFHAPNFTKIWGGAPSPMNVSLNLHNNWFKTKRIKIVSKQEEGQTASTPEKI